MLLNYQEYYAKHLFSPDKYERFLRRMDEVAGMKIEYRICEMPAFISTAFRHQLEEAARAIVQECTEGAYLERATQSLQPQYTVPHQTARPVFATVDFAVTRNADTGEFEPKLIELQGFPSLYAYQYAYSVEMLNSFTLSPQLYFVLGDSTPEEYQTMMQKLLVGDCSPENVVLLEYKPEQQKTRPDFLFTERYWGVRATDICSVKKDGRRLLYERDGRWIPIERIYNRAIVDELHDNGVVLPFNWTDELDVEWVGHPNWYFLMSKFSMPYLHHKSVPKTYFLNTLDAIPNDLSTVVLKPLFAFAGKGVNVQPTVDDIRAIPEQERPHWILQERVQYAECFYTPEGMNKGEIRLLLVWVPGAAEPQPVLSLFRTGRGPMMGSRYNTISWAGTSSCFFGDEASFLEMS